MESIPASWYLTGCELYAGLHSQPSGFRYFAHNRNWNLLLPEAGSFRVFINNESYTFAAGDLVLLAPGPPREFLVLESLKIRWIHFNLDAHLQYRPEWPSPGRHVYLIHPESAAAEFMRLFAGILQLCTFRQKGWYRLGYCMIQEILLRGNMLNEKGLDQEHIDFAARILRDVSSAASITDLAKQCALSRAVFFRKFRETFGMSPGQYREQQRLNYVREQLESGTKSLKEIAELCGFDNAFYLSARFRKMFGVSPREYRRNYRSNLAADQ